MYDYLREIPPVYKNEYKNLVINSGMIPCKSDIKYQFTENQTAR